LGLSRPWEQHDFLHAVGALGRSATLAEACEIIGKERDRQTSPRSLRDMFDVGSRRFPHLELKSPGHYLNQTGQVPVIEKAESHGTPATNPARVSSASTSDVPATPGRFACESSLTAQPDHGVVGAAVSKIMVCPDVHVPYQDELAWSTFLRAVEVVRPDALVIIGDFADCLSVSFHPKTPERKISLKAEIEAVNTELDRVGRLGVPRVIYCAGNHEFRAERYLTEKAPELFGMIAIQDLLRVKERGWEWVPYKQWIRIGKTAFTHDVERCGVNATRQSLLDFGGNLVFGHSHRGGIAYQGTVEGDQHVAMNVGWLGSYAAIDYRNAARAKRDWQHGFGIVYQDSAGYSWMQFVPVLSGRCIVDGHVVSGRKAA
jgi:predicted phosphodiesterase